MAESFVCVFIIVVLGYNFCIVYSFTIQIHFLFSPPPSSAFCILG
eukprot:UN01402